MSNITDWLVSETSCMVLLSELPPPFPHRLQWGRCLLDRQRWKSSFKGILYWRSNSQGCLKDGPSHVMWPEVYKNAYGETDSSTFPLKWADMTVACSGAHRLIGRSAFLKGLFVLIQADVGGVWSLDLCGWDLSVGTLHCNVKLFTCFNIWCSTSICVCLEFFFFSFFLFFLCNIPVYEPYLIIWNISPGPKPVMVLPAGLCVMQLHFALPAFRSLRHWILSNVQAFNVLLVSVFIGVLLNLFSTVLHFCLWSFFILLLDVGWVTSAPT